MYKRFIIEFGTGADLHGMDVNKAAKRAVKDAISHCCLCGLTEVLNLSEAGLNERLKIEVILSSPFSEKIDPVAAIADIPFGSASVEVREGGLSVTGLEVESLGAGNQIVLVNAALTVFVETDG
jgi:uncharacterized protein (TIGR02058 family)